MKKYLYALAPLVAAILTLAGVGPAEAKDGTHLRNGDTVWTKAYCEGGKHTHTWTLQGHPNARIKTYVRNRHVCAFLSFPSATKHHLEISFGRYAINTYQQGWYKSYAGAIAAPAGACRWVGGALLTSKGNYWIKGGYTHRVCG